MYSLKYYTKFIDECVKRKITSSERLVALWNGLTELPKCCVCGEVGVKYTRAIKQHMEWCSQKCLKKISVLRNKTQEELNVIDDKKRMTWNNKTQEEKDTIVSKGIITKRNNGTNYNVLSKPSQELFNHIYDNMLDTDNIWFGELNCEKGIKTVNGIKHVDFCYKNKVIEFYGDNVHASPYKFREEDIYNYHKTVNKLVGDKWKEDTKRIKGIIEQGYDVLIVWSGEFYNNKENTINKCINFLTN